MTTTRNKGLSLGTLVGHRFHLSLAFLAVPLLITLLIAGVHVREQSRYRRAVESAAVDMARVVLKDAFDVLFNRAGGSVAGVMNAAAAVPDQQDLEAQADAMWRAATREGADVPLPVTAVMMYDPTSDRLATGGAGVEETRWRARLTESGVLLDGPLARRLVTVASEDAEGPYFAYFARVALPGQPWFVAAVEVDLDRMGRLLVAPAVEAAERVALEGRDTDLHFGVRVTHPSGRVVFEQGRPEVGPTYRLDLFGPDLGSSNAARTRPFDASLSVPPQLLGHVIPGGMPGSPWPLVASSVALALLLTSLAGLLLWRIRELVLLRERFVSSVSHELRTPLAQMLVYAETLQLDRPTPMARRRAVDVIVRETRRLVHLVENALTFTSGSRPDTGYHPAPVDLGPAVERILADLEALARSHGATVELVREQDVRVVADTRMLHRIVLNLVDNALSYGPRGQRVRVTIAATGSRAELMVDDEGSGIPPADRSRLWKAFERGTDHGSGTGLGLSIVAQLVEIQGGEVEVGDAPSGGARFTVRLPLLREAAQPLPSDESRGPRSDPSAREAAWRAS